MEKENLRSTLPAQPADPARRLSSEDEIDLVELFYVLWGHVWQIALCLILGAALAFGYTYFLAEPQYKATSSIYCVGLQQLGGQPHRPADRRPADRRLPGAAAEPAPAGRRDPKPSKAAFQT